MPKTVTMYLKHQNDDLYYSMDNRNFKPLEETTVTGADSGDIFQWKLAEGSNIEKINNIKVNEDKGGGKNRVDFWEQKPKAINKTKTIFEGSIKSGLDKEPKFNGYTIQYRTVDGEKEKDPDIKVPSGGTGDDNG